MHGILNPEGPVMSFITKITYSAYLNLLWLICCLPIVTAGARSEEHTSESSHSNQSRMPSSA